MMYSARLKQILLELLDLPEASCMPVNVLAQKIGVSRRTIFREIEGVETLLGCHDVILESVPRKGLRLTGATAALDAFRHDLEADEEIYMDKGLRRKLLAFELLNSSKAQKLSHYAAMFDVSESTISKDLEPVTVFLESCQIQLSKSATGTISIHAAETDRRKAMSILLHMDSTPKSNTATFFIPANSPLFKMLDEQLVRQIKGIMEQHAAILHLDQYASSALSDLLVHLVIMIRRIVQDKSLSLQADELPEIPDVQTLEEANLLADYLEDALGYEVPLPERRFIALHMAAAKPAFSAQKMNDGNDTLRQLIDSIILAYDADTAFLLMHDEKYINGMAMHLEPALYRIQAGLPIYNPLLDSIKLQYPALFLQSQKAAAVLSEKLHAPVSDAEAAFLTMHAGACIERSRLSTRSTRPEVGIACAEGTAAAVLLSARLKKRFSSRIHVTTLGLSELTPTVQNHFDLVISHEALKLADVPCIQVSPLLSEKDICRIEEQLARLSQNSSHRSVKDFKKQLDFMNEASAAVSSLLSHFCVHHVDAALNKQQLIELAASLARQDAVQLQKDLMARESLGSIISDEYGFAMFHACTCGVDEPQFFVMYPEARNFEHPDLHNISFVLISLLPKPYDKVQQELLSLLSASLIEDPLFYNVLLDRDESAVLIRMNSILQDYIYKHI